RPPPRGDPYCSGGANFSARTGCTRLPSGAVHGGRLAAISHGARTTVPEAGTGPSQDHEESTLEEEPPLTPGRPRAALSGNVGGLALSRIVDPFNDGTRSSQLTLAFDVVLLF